MALPRFEVALGTPDGSNTLFQTPSPYVPNTLAVFVNGKLYRRDWDDGWVETNPMNGVFTMKEAPLSGDAVQVFFSPEADFEPPESYETCGLCGTVSVVDVFEGAVLEVTELAGRIVPCGC